MATNDALASFRPGHGRRLPRERRSPPRCSGSSLGTGRPQVPGGRLHGGRDDVLSRSGPNGQLLPRSLVGGAVVVPRCADVMARFWAAVTESAGFAKSAGFVDDTRVYCSIPARHDLARRSPLQLLGPIGGGAPYRD